MCSRDTRTGSATSPGRPTLASRGATSRLPPRCVSSLLGLRYAADLTRLGGAGQDRAHLDKRHPDVAVGQDRARPVLRVRVAHVGRARTRGQVPGRGVARIVELGGEHTGGELRRREGDAMEGEPEGCVGVRERHDELGVSYAVWTLS